MTAEKLAPVAYFRMVTTTPSSCSHATKHAIARASRLVLRTQRRFQTDR
jgi:hypothetical protein